ncbi:hypothetical protein G6F62_014707 [Rhizopus arrhizus]|nr:hypothetical protein G6F62_014707 [Rhizopus arrhizus]
MLQPVLVGVVGEHHRAATQRIDQRPGHRQAHRRAAQAAAKPPLQLRGGRVHEGRAMDDDRAFARTVVEARLQPDQAQRVAVAAHVGLLRGERAEAGHETAVAIGEMLAGAGGPGRTPTAAARWTAASSRSR